MPTELNLIAATTIWPLKRRHSAYIVLDNSMDFII